MDSWDGMTAAEKDEAVLAVVRREEHWTPLGQSVPHLYYQLKGRFVLEAGHVRTVLERLVRRGTLVKDVTYHPARYVRR